MANLTTLAASSSVVITVTEQQSIVLNNGRTDKARLQITTGPNAGAVVADNHIGRRVYGPFGAGTITLSAIVGDVRYELSGDAESPLGDDYEFTSAQSDSLRSLVSGAWIPVIDATRNSANAAADADEVTLATFVVPGGVLQLGSIVEVFAIFENTNSASTKTLALRVDGTSMSSYTTTTNQSYGVRFPFHVHDESSIIVLNNGSVGVGGASGLSFSKTIAGVMDVGFTITITCKWNAAAAGEFIRLKHSKFKVTF